MGKSFKKEWEQKNQKTGKESIQKGEIMLIQTQPQAQQWFCNISGQKVAIYPNFKKGTYTARFFVDNYVTASGKKHSQRSYVNNHKTAKEAKEFAENMCWYLSPKTAGDEKFLTSVYKNFFRIKK